MAHETVRPELLRTARNIRAQENRTVVRRWMLRTRNARRCAYRYTPVLPNPPSPRSLGGNFATSSSSTSSTR